MAKFNKEKFKHSELFHIWKETCTAWDFYLRARDYKNTEILQGKHEGIQAAVSQFYGVDYHFTRTDDFFGLVTEDYSDWLFKEVTA